MFVIHFASSCEQACWFVSNLASITGDESTIDALLRAALLPTLVELLTFGDFDTKKECAWVQLIILIFYFIS